MDSRVEAILLQLKNFIDFDIVRRLFFLVGIAVSVAIGFGIYQWTQEPIYRPLDFKTDSKDIVAIMQVLDEANLPYKLNETTGIISVPASDFNLARMKLSAAGIQKEEGFNFSFLNDKSALGSSAFFESARYLRALEEDLSKAITSIQGISSAIVHIAKPQANIFVGENNKTTASVIIHINPGYEGDREKIRAIIQIIAASVPELDPRDVAITDQYGHYLSASSDTSFLRSQEQLNYQHSIEQNYEKRIQALIFPLLGENKASVNVNVELDFTQQETAKESYDPKEKIIRSEQSIKEDNTSSAATGVPGSLSNQPPNNSNANSQGGSSRSEEVKNYEVNKSTSYIKTEVPVIRKISLAVVLDNAMAYDEKSKKMVSKPLDSDKLAAITALVKSSIGFNQDRGDVVTVFNSPFVQPKEEVYQSQPLWQEPWFWDLSKKLLGIVLGFIFLFLMYRKLSKELKEKNSPKDLTMIEEKGGNLMPEEMLKLKNEQIAALQQLVAQDPNKVVGVIRKWVAKETI